MGPIATNTTGAARPSVPVGDLLQSGDRLTLDEFHWRYEMLSKAYPGLRAELVKGVVYVNPPTSGFHSRRHYRVDGWLFTYQLATPGVDGSTNGTWRPESTSEVQPDAALRLLPEVGGRSTFDERGYLVGPVELVVEVTRTTASYDLHDKKEAYRQAGCQEYVVLLTETAEVLWHVLRDGRYALHAPDDQGVHRSTVFPGLWLDGAALFASDDAKLVGTLRRGIATPEHVAFVAANATRTRKQGP